MKRNNMKWAAMPIAALCLTLAGCSSDDAVETPTATTRPLTISASLGADNANAGTRAGIKPDNTDQSKEVFIWHTGDTFAAWLTNAGGTEFEAPTATTPLPVFTIDSKYNSDVSPSGSASFTCSNFPADRNYKIVAVYPTDKVFSMRTSTLLQCKISAASFLQAEKNSTNHLAADMAMCATATVQAGATSANLTFRHLTSLFRFTLKNENASNCQITQIKVSSDAAIFPYDWSLDLEGNLVGSSMASPYLILKFGQEIDGRPTGFNLAAGASFDSYALSGPSTVFFLTDRTLTFTITVKDADGTNEREYTSRTLAANKIIKKNGGATTWEAGKRYWFDLTLKGQLAVTVTVGAWTDGTEIGGGEAIPLVEVAPATHTLTLHKAGALTAEHITAALDGGTTLTVNGTSNVADMALLTAATSLTAIDLRGMNYSGISGTLGTIPTADWSGCTNLTKILINAADADAYKAAWSAATGKLFYLGKMDYSHTAKDGKAYTCKVISLSTSSVSATVVYLTKQPTAGVAPARAAAQAELDKKGARFLKKDEFEKLVLDKTITVSAGGNIFCHEDCVGYYTGSKFLYQATSTNPNLTASYFLVFDI